MGRFTARFALSTPAKTYLVRLMIIGVMALYCTTPLLVHKGLPDAHDTVFHVFQAEQFSRVFHEGTWYPRWIADANSGYGSPTFVFYAPLSYFAVSLTMFFVPTVTEAMILVIWGGFFLSGAAMYEATSRMYGGWGSLVAAVSYQILPFHLGDLYVRGTFAELLGFIWLPLIILCLHTIRKSGSRNAMAGLSVSYAGLVMTHLVTAFMFSFVIAGYIVYFFLSRAGKHQGKTILSLLLGAGLAACYLLPVILERKYVHMEYLLNCAVCDYRKNFLFMWEGMQAVLSSFYMRLHIWVILEVMLCLVIALVLRKKNLARPERTEQRFFLALFVTAFFLTTPLSSPLWKIIPELPTLQFPWRWIVVMEVVLCFLTAQVFGERAMSQRPGRGLGEKSILYIVSTFVLLSFLTIYQSTIYSQDLLKRVLDPEQFHNFIDPTIEYTPVWTDTDELISGLDDRNISVFSGEALFEIAEWASARRAFSVDAKIPSTLRISTFYYPGWKAYVNDQRVSIGIEQGTGAMLVTVPEGSSGLLLKFEDTPARDAGKIISLVSFLCFGILAAGKEDKLRKTL